jgi:hypothetical protein
MQNIAEDFQDTFDAPIDGEQWKELSTFVAYNDRKKTISTTKKAYVEGGSLDDTPQGAFNDLQSIFVDLFTSCGMEVANEVLLSIHPALGPNWSIIRQKVVGGDLKSKSELELEIAELEMKECTIVGSLRIIADDSLQGQCSLIDVKVENQGLDSDRCGFWEGRVDRKESLTIKLLGHAAFVAQNVHFFGDMEIVVPDGYRYVAYNRGKQVELRKERIEVMKPLWHLCIDPYNQINVTRWTDISF